jgi:hypothetical protein
MDSTPENRKGNPHVSRGKSHFFHRGIAGPKTLSAAFAITPIMEAVPQAPQA